MSKKSKTIIVDSIKQVDMSDLTFPQIVIYSHPEDYPKDCVARVFDNGVPTNIIMIKQSVNELECDIKSNTAMIFYPRGADDVLSLIGVWM